jgi:hypothetical protein
LQTGRDVRRFAQHSSINCFANDNNPGCDTDPDAQFDVAIHELQVQLAYAVNYCQACTH